MTGCLRQMKEEDLSLVLQWRNHPDVRHYMYSQNLISPEEHAKWFVQLSREGLHTALLFIVDEIPQGYVNFKQSPVASIADWGFYLAPAAPKGTGGQLGHAALNHAFLVMGLHKVCAQALGFNEKSIRFHLRLGFRREGVLREQYFDGEKYHDIESFGLLSAEWLGANDEA